MRTHSDADLLLFAAPADRAPFCPRPICRRARRCLPAPQEGPRPFRCLMLSDDEAQEIISYVRARLKERFAHEWEEEGKAVRAARRSAGAPP